MTQRNRATGALGEAWMLLDESQYWCRRSERTARQRAKRDAAKARRALDAVEIREGWKSLPPGVACEDVADMEGA